ncbi:MAG: hypothetical protein ACE5FV_12325 [Woeseia sp.]
MSPNGFEYDIGFDNRGESMYESPLVVRSTRFVRFHMIRRAFAEPVITGISQTFVSIRNIRATLLSPVDWKRTLASILLLLLAIPSHAGDDAQHEYLLFPSLELFDNTAPDDVLLDGGGYVGIADFMYSYSGNRLRILGEYVLSNEESHMERLKAGWLFGEQTMLWVGRFHQPSKYWTTEHHHGQYLQTSISRPGIEEWEDRGGAISTHITGLMLETGQIRKDSSGYQIAVSAGFAPLLTQDGLEPFELWDPSSDHGPAYNFRVTFLPDYFGNNQFGILGGWSELEVDRDNFASQPGTESVEQLQLGSYMDWRWEQLRIIFNMNYLQDKHIRPDGNFTDTFWSGYLQAEYALGLYWTVYGRHENSFGEDGTGFIRLIPKLPSQKNLFGVRWDIATDHALTLEIADTKTETSDLDEYRLQWSAVFP